jgi:UTP--glucose-1-phosphate uridylyltransferase
MISTEIGLMLGEKLGFVKTTIEFALQHEELRSDVLKIMEELLKKEMIHN